MVAANMMLHLVPPDLRVRPVGGVRGPSATTGPHTGVALGLVGLIGLAFINAQAFIYSQMRPAA